MMRFEYDSKFIKLLAKEMVKEMQKVKVRQRNRNLSPSRKLQKHLICRKIM